MFEHAILEMRIILDPAYKKYRQFRNKSEFKIRNSGKEIMVNGRVRGTKYTEL